MNRDREPATAADRDAAGRRELRGGVEERMEGRAEPRMQPPDVPASRSAAAAPAPRTHGAVRHDDDRRLDAHRDERHELIPGDEAGALRGRWTEVQAAFVDEPRAAVERADALVADAMSRLSQVFASERAALEQQWDRGEQVTTEDLRIALQRYRAFFDRLLSL